MLSNSISNIIVGLGNPGEKYENTRHNAGFMAVDFIARKYNVDLKIGRFNAEVGIFLFENRKVVLLRPQTFMNLSGESLRSAMNFYKINSKNVIIILDDVNFPVGRMRIRDKGSHGGHNGMKNILQICGSDGFPRIKIGVGQKPEDFPLDKWVISDFQNSEKIELSKIFPYVEEACRAILRGEILQAMNNFNGLDFSEK